MSASWPLAGALVTLICFYGAFRARVPVPLVAAQKATSKREFAETADDKLQGLLYTEADLQRLQQRARDMFYHGYDNYMRHAFPHDDLKPLSETYADSLGEIGSDGTQKQGEDYQGVALTLIDLLSTLAVLGDATEFEKNVNWIISNLTFNADVRVNVFEANIRLLGGLLSAHGLAADEIHGPRLMPHGYSGGLLDLAYSLGLRLLPAFLESPTGLPYPWINLRKGLNKESLDVTETNAAACGSLILEFGALSRWTGNPVFETAALRALDRLWAMRSSIDLLGSSIDMQRGSWKDTNGGIGPSGDSFFEYLLKAYILLDQGIFWEMFQEAYLAAVKHYKLGSWYHDALFENGNPTFIQFSALQAFWPGLQVLAGDVLQAAATFQNFMSVWHKFGMLPERYAFGSDQLHPTEHYYPLRPELMESNLYLFQATRDKQYLANGETFMDDLHKYAWAPGGWASIQSVVNHEQQDHMHSYFLAEACKYLFLLYNDTFIKEGNFVFSTEGHPFRVDHRMQRRGMGQRHRPVQGNATWSTLQEHPYWKAHPRARAKTVDPELTWTHTLVCESITRGNGMCEIPSVGGEPGTDDQETSASGTTASFEAWDAKDVHQIEHPRYVHMPWQEPPEWGVSWSNNTALDARICPVYGHGLPVSSLCHIPDKFEDSRCTTAQDCGVDAGMLPCNTCLTTFYLI